MIVPLVSGGLNGSSVMKALNVSRADAYASGVRRVRPSAVRLCRANGGGSTGNG